MFKHLKEITSKELKKSVRMPSQQLENIESKCVCVYTHTFTFIFIFFLELKYTKIEMK